MHQGLSGSEGLHTEPQQQQKYGTTVDDAPIPPKISSLTECAAILTIVCVCTGTLQLVPVRSQTARETVFLLLVNWIRVYGIPLGMQSDGHANFVSALMKAALSMFGVRDQMVSAPNQKGTAAKSEKTNQYVRKIIDIMVANGDATNEDSLRQYCAIAEMQANQLQCIAGHTSYKLCFGKTPRTILDLVTYAPIDVAQRTTTTILHMGLEHGNCNNIVHGVFPKHSS